MSGKAILRAMHVVVAKGPGILLTNSPGWNFMSEIGLAHAGSSKARRQNKSNAWFYCFYQKCYFFRSDSLTHLTHRTSVLLWNKFMVSKTTCTSDTTLLYLDISGLPSPLTLFTGALHMTRQNISLSGFIRKYIL